MFNARSHLIARLVDLLRIKVLDHAVAELDRAIDQVRWLQYETSKENALMNPARLAEIESRMSSCRSDALVPMGVDLRVAELRALLDAARSDEGFRRVVEEFLPGDDGVGMIARERVRQVKEEKFGADHDATHTRGELVLAAAAYLMASVRGNASVAAAMWPFELVSFSPQALDVHAVDTLGQRGVVAKSVYEGVLKNLVRAGALVAAEIDRIVRAEGDA